MAIETKMGFCQKVSSSRVLIVLSTVNRERGEGRREREIQRKRQIIGFDKRVFFSVHLLMLSSRFFFFLLYLF